MLTNSERLKKIEACFGPGKISASGNNVSVVCLTCHDAGNFTKKKKLSIEIETGVYHCWVCEAKGANPGRLAMKSSSCSNLVGAKSLFQIYQKKTEKVEEIVKEEHAKLPGDFKLVFNLENDKNFRLHYAYLKNRGMNNITMKRLRIGVSDEYAFKNRVIFPSFDTDQRLNYFVSRTIDPSETYKYKNFKGKKKEVIFREIDLDFSKELILTEGVFDLMHCPENSTCILGSWLDENYKLFQKIIKNKTPVILCLDPDAKEKSLKIAKSLSEYCVDVKISQHIKDDFGSMTKKEVHSHILNAKRYDITDRIGYLIGDICSGSIF